VCHLLGLIDKCKPVSTFAMESFGRINGFVGAVRVIGSVGCVMLAAEHPRMIWKIGCDRPGGRQGLTQPIKQRPHSSLSLAASLHMKKIAPGMIVKGGNFGGLSCLALCLAEMFYCHRFVEMS